VRESGVPAAIARISTVVGDSATGHIARLQAFHYLLGAALRGLVPFMPGEPGTRADLVPQDVVASALAAMATTEIGDGEYWITAGSAALPLERIISIAGDVAAERLRRDGTAPKIYLPAFLPHIVRPQTYRRVMAMLLANAGPDSRPSGLANLDKLIACYHADEPFPTSFDLLPGGPPAPTEPSIEKSLIATCHYLASLPKEHWSMY
jgi:nucleoside-diphosphate-sugar epimerase